MRNSSLWLWLLLAACGVAQAQWDLQESHSTADLRGIDNVGSGVAWASGANGTVLRTFDGGEAWQTCAVPPGAEHLDFRGIQSFDANTAIVMSSGKGDLSRLYKTTDGCHTWKLIFRNPDKEGSWDALHFDRHQWLGWLLGDPVKGTFVLFASDDAGKNWIRQHNRGLRVQQGTEIALAASNSSLTAIGGWVTIASGGAMGAFEYSIVGLQICIDACSEADNDREGRGNKWNRLPIPVGNHSDSSGVFSIGVGETTLGAPFFRSMVAVGGDYLKPDDSVGSAAFSEATDPAKLAWHPAQSMPHGFRSAVAYDADAKTWITVGPNGTDISTDDGRNWRALHPDPALNEAPDADRNWNALSLPFAVGPHGRIGKLDPHALGR